MTKPIEKLVRILVRGGRVLFDGYEYAMTENGELCTIMKDDKGKEIPIAVECSLGALNKMAEDIGNDELWLKLCAMQLKNL